MRVRVVSPISGTRNGRDWPPPGAEWDLPDEEAESYIDSGFVVAVAPKAKRAVQHRPDDGVERAVFEDPTAERRGPPRAADRPTAPDKPAPSPPTPAAAPEKPAPMSTATGPVKRV